jgi:hypothetical protein
MYNMRIDASNTVTKTAKTMAEVRCQLSKAQGMVTITQADREIFHGNASHARTWTDGTLEVWRDMGYEE